MFEKTLTLWNDKTVVIPQLPPKDVIDRFAEPFLQATRHTVDSAFGPNLAPGFLRLSQLGKPVHVLAYNYFYGNRIELEFKSMWNFFQGNIAEALVVKAAELAGEPIQEQQKTVEFCGVRGHIDGYIQDERGICLVEIKSMSATYYNSFLREPSNDRGYLTQAACYAKALLNDGHKHVRVVFLCLNKSNGELSAVNWRPTTHYIRDAEAKIRVIQSINTYLDLFKTHPLPDPVPEIKRKKPTGRWLPPPGYANFAHLFYPMLGEYIDYGRFIDEHRCNQSD